MLTKFILTSNKKQKEKWCLQNVPGKGEIECCEGEEEPTPRDSINHLFSSVVLSIKTKIVPETVLIVVCRP